MSATIWACRRSADVDEDVQRGVAAHRGHGRHEQSSAHVARAASASDPLEPFMALSAEEKIALFT